MARVPHKCEAFQGEFLIGSKTITADSYVRDHQKFQKIYGSIADEILKLKQEGDFLEVGAGGATLTTIVAKKNRNISIVATDKSEDMVRLGTEILKKEGLNSRVDYIHSAGEDIDFQGRKFDMIYSSFSFNYWKSPISVINKLQQHLKPGGVIFVMDFRRVWWVRLIPQFIWRDVPVILAGYTRKEVYRLFGNSLEMPLEVRKIYPLSLALVIRNNRK